MEERWLPIRDSKFYSISDQGRVRLNHAVYMRNNGKPFTTQEKILSGCITRCGYHTIALHWDVQKQCLVHRLVLEAFAPTPGMEDLQVNHIDGCKTHNWLSNLEWVTREQNMQHAMKMGLWVPLYAQEDKNPNTIIRQADVDEIRKLLASGFYTQREIAHMYNVSDTVISNIKHNVRRFANM